MTLPYPPVWTEGVCGDGAAILRDGRPVTIPDVLAALNLAEEVRDAAENVVIAAGMGWDLDGVIEQLLRVMNR